jgi:GH25 family lysozyme M1 (1,4-beta-N-acetylmuramidase)
VRTAGTGARKAILIAGLCLVVGAIAPSAAFAKTISGIDVSRFQGEIEWERVGETKVEFAFVQASRGDGGDCAVAPDRCGADEFYEANYLGATEAGIRVGAYHRAFADGRGRKSARRDARKEANLFLDHVGALREGDLLPALDLESPFGGLNRRSLRAWVHTWLKKVRARLDVRPIIYTNTSSWQATGDTRKFARRGHRLWVANWGVSSPSVPADDWNGEGWTIWQYTSSGRVKGIDGRVDRNHLRVGLDAIAVG